MTDNGRFFAILSRHFVTSFMHQLSRCAVRVYAYLRTWCTSGPGDASPWRILRVETIAEALDWTARHVRRGLRELREARLLESRSTFESLADGTRVQGPNEWRVLAEGGRAAPTAEAPVAPPPVEEPPAVQAIVPHLEEALDALPGWVAEATDEAAEEIEQLTDHAAELESPDPYRERVLKLSQAAADAQAAALRASAAELEQRRAELQALQAWPAERLAAAGPWRDALIRAVHQRAQAVTRRRDQATITPQAVAQALDDLLLRRGFPLDSATVGSQQHRRGVRCADEQATGSDQGSPR